jgi:hypothetical protein
MEGSIQKLGGVKRYVQFLEISDDPELVAQYRKSHSEKYSWNMITGTVPLIIFQQKLW